MMQAQSLAQLLRPTTDEKWKVFSTVRSFPTPMPDLMRDANVSPIRFYGALTELEQEGLIVQHCADPVEWRLADAA